MKKYIYLALVAIVLAACTDKTGPMGPQGPRGEDGLVNFKIIDLQVNSEDWVYSNQQDNNYWVAEFSVPELTDYIYNNGVVQLYREYATGTANASQVMLPSTRHYETTNDDGSVGYYTETTDYEMTVGTLYVYHTPSDFYFGQAPEDMHFRLVLMW